MDDQQGFGQQKRYQGQWTCSECGTEITELPFEPDGKRPIFCRQCHQANKRNRPRRQF